MPPSLRSPACHRINPDNAARPNANAAAVSGSAGARSRRNTRSVDTLRRRSSGGSVKPSSSTNPIATPRNPGNGPGKGRLTVKNDVSHDASTACPT